MIKIKTQILAYEHAEKKSKQTKRLLNYIQLVGKYVISVENLILAIPMQKTGPKRRIWPKIREVTAANHMRQNAK